MQTNELVGQAKHGPRRGRVKQAQATMREAPESRAQGLGADESRPRAPRPPASKPHRYGAGF